jgi:hypothetical protein
MTIGGIKAWCAGELNGPRGPTFANASARQAAGPTLPFRDIQYRTRVKVIETHVSHSKTDIHA